jgi:hypothetical protein
VGKRLQREGNERRRRYVHLYRIYTKAAQEEQERERER